MTGERANLATGNAKCRSSTKQVWPRQHDIALGDCLWHVYRLIGKLSDRIYLLSKPET
jgi:hypothetical protein